MKFVLKYLTNYENSLKDWIINKNLLINKIKQITSKPSVTINYKD